MIAIEIPLGNRWAGRGTVAGGSAIFALDKQVLSGYSEIMGEITRSISAKWHLPEGTYRRRLSNCCSELLWWAIDFVGCEGNTHNDRNATYLIALP